MAKLILGFTGPIASGKEVAKKYIETNYGGSNFKFSSILRDILNYLDVENNRDNLIDLSTFLRIRYGEDILAKAIAKKVKDSNENIIVVDGIRRLADITYLKKVPGFILIAIDASPEIRYQRSVTRNENPGDDQKSYETFLADHQKETELTIPGVMAQANYTIDNSGGLEHLHQEIDKIILAVQNNQK
jgi:dephospho-CoA kinase